MSAPEPRVRVDGWSYTCDGCGVKMMPFAAAADSVRMAADAHAEKCAPLKLARLQARWDARDKALHDLVGQWLDAADAPPESVIHGGIQRIIRQCADELTRAIGDDDA